MVFAKSPSMPSPRRPAYLARPSSTTSRSKKIWCSTGLASSKNWCSPGYAIGPLGSVSLTPSELGTARSGRDCTRCPIRLPDPQPRGGFFHLVAASPALQAYGRELNARTARRIADAIAAPSGETRDDLRPRVVADALLAVYAATFDAIQRRIVAGEHPKRFLDAILDQADASLDLLKEGIRKFP